MAHLLISQYYHIYHMQSNIFAGVLADKEVIVDYEVSAKLLFHSPKCISSDLRQTLIQRQF